VAEAIESILVQTFADFELIISDNASTDATYDICERFARSDPRVKLSRHMVNVGANRNYRTVLAGATGEYFKWASSNDLCAPTFVEKCVTALDRDPGAVLACPRSSLFETTMAAAQPYDRDVELAAEEPARRFAALFTTMGLNNAVNGLIRRSALMRASALGNYLQADIVLMGELALLGKFLLVDERLFFRRMSSAAATKYKSAREVGAHIVPNAKRPLRWQSWRYHLGLLQAARLTRFPSRDWLRVVRFVVAAFFWSRRALVDDALDAVRPATW
jgi:glycosyltransferase involved in cell wall biosynthesis